MRVVSVNIATLRGIPYRGETVMTGIFKEPAAGRIRMQTLGLAGDHQADLKVHGGIYKAVYAYPIEHYEFWMRELGRNDFACGQFGENLTVTGLSEDTVHVGDIFRMGTALVEVTQPRVPCFKLAFKMNAPDFIKRFTESGRVGFYARVLTEGEVAAGDGIECIKTDPRGVTVKQMMKLKHAAAHDFSLMERAVNIPALTPSWREDFKGLLQSRKPAAQSPRN